MMEADRIAVCGPKDMPDSALRAVRGGTTASQVVLEHLPEDTRMRASSEP